MSDSTDRPLGFIANDDLTGSMLDALTAALYGVTPDESRLLDEWRSRHSYEATFSPDSEDDEDIE